MDKQNSVKNFNKPEEINPELTKDFSNFMIEKSKSKKYRVNVKISNKNIPIDVFPTVFPPRSNYSVSSKSVFETFGNLRGLEVADIGCGSGIESIVAVMAGAKHVDASDINQEAVNCSQHNINLNKLGNYINVFYSDIFHNFPKKKYDFIISNLPIVNFSAEDNIVNSSLYDKNFQIHKRLFIEAKQFLANNGIITFTHANLQSGKTTNPNYDFDSLEMLISKCGYKVVEKIERDDLSYKWINYKIKINI